MKKHILSSCLLYLALISLTACSSSFTVALAPNNSHYTPVEANPQLGNSLFQATCADCHGENGQGIEGVGKDLVHNEFVTTLSDSELVEFIKVGRKSNDPLNTSRTTMPARGGQSTLTDAEIHHIVAYLRTLQPSK